MRRGPRACAAPAGIDHEGASVKVGLNQLIDDELVAHVEESRAFLAASAASASSRPPPDPSTPDGLRAARNMLTSRPAPAGRLVTEHVAEAGTRQARVRIITPEARETRAVYLEIHGGGFYLSSAARSDAGTLASPMPWA
jgi:acetyl esterase